MPLATPDPRRRLFVQGAMLGTLRLVAAFNVILLVAICLFLLVQGLPALSWEFLSTPPREMMTAGGILPCIVGTAILALGSLLLAFPLGVATAVYLHEYAGNTPFARMVRLGVNNLAGVPSVVFGLFGLSFFVTFCGMGVSILSGILTLAVLTLPVIISTAEESLRSVPDTYRQASLALGAGKAQTITRVVLPCAMPGMLTGAILGVARAAGETAAIMFTAAVFYTPKNPDSIFSSVMALPYHMYVLATAGTDIEKTRPLQYGTGLVLILLVLGMNLLAIILRDHLQRRHHGIRHRLIFLGDFLLRQRGPLFCFFPATTHVFRRPRSRAGGLSRHPASPDAPTAARKTGVCQPPPVPAVRHPLAPRPERSPSGKMSSSASPALSGRIKNANGPEGRSLPARHLAI